MSRSPSPPVEPPSAPQPRSRKRCLKYHDEAEPPSNLRRTVRPEKTVMTSASTNYSSDSDAHKSSPHKRNPEYGLAVAKKYLPSLGTRFSPDLNVIEGYGDSADVDDIDDGSGYRILSGSLPRIVPRQTKIEEVDDPSQLKQNAVDRLISLLIECVAARAEQARKRAQELIDELTRMEVAEKRGDDFFDSAMKYLCEGNNSYVFMAHLNDDQRWIYLGMMKK